MTRGSTMISFLLATLAGAFLGSRFGATNSVFADDKKLENEQVICKSLVIVDKKGKKRIELFVDKNGPAIELYSVDSKPRIELVIDDDNPLAKKRGAATPSLTMYGVDGSPEVYLLSSPSSDGSHSGGGLTLGSLSDPGQMSLSVRPNGESQIELTGEEGGSMTLRMIPKTAAMFCIQHPNNEHLFSASSNFEKKNTKAVIRDANGKELWKVP